jgi:hypothetical protein
VRPELRESEQRKDRGRVDIGHIGPTEDAAMRRFPAAAAPCVALKGQSSVQARDDMGSRI